MAGLGLIGPSMLRCTSPAALENPCSIVIHGSRAAPSPGLYRGAGERGPALCVPPAEKVIEHARTSGVSRDSRRRRARAALKSARLIRQILLTSGSIMGVEF